MNSLLWSVADLGRLSSLSKPGNTQVVIVLLLSSWLLSTPGHCRANETCPWLNEATAAGFLDGSVTSIVTYPHKDKNDANCGFIHRDGAIVTTLQIEVETMSTPPTQFQSYLAECGPNPEPVRAIGNEAVACSLEEKKGNFTDFVVGRVRDRVFVVRIRAKGDESERAKFAVRARKIAEQVAGILF